MNPSIAIQTGGPAARRMYDTLELRQRVLMLLPKRTLAVLLRVERAITGSVAAELYKSVNVSLMSEMSTEDARRTIYCEAVRTLDLSPRPQLISSKPNPRVDENSPPIRFDPEVFLADLAEWRQQYPFLQSIHNRYPSNERDDAYVAHLTGDIIRVELESPVCFDTFTIPFVAPTSASFPPSFTYHGMEIHQTFGVRLMGLLHQDILFRFSRDPEEVEGHWQKWKDWIFRNPTLDRRISYIDIEEDHMASWSIKGITLEEAMTFLARRKEDKCEPITRWTIPIPNKPFTVDEFRDFIVELGPKLRVLRLGKGALSGIKDIPLVVSILEEFCPGLQHLDFWPQSPTKDGMDGLKHLRKLTLRHYKGDIRKTWPGMLARHLSSLGSDECLYEIPVYGTVKEMAKVNKLIHKERLSLEGG